MIRRALTVALITLLGLLLSSCSDPTPESGEPTSTSNGETEPTSPPPPIPSLVSIVNISAVATSVNISSSPSALAVAWVSDDGVFVAEVDPDGQADEPIRVNGELSPFAHPIERPAVAVVDGEAIHVAFTTLQETGGSVAYNVVANGLAGDPEVISGSPRPETNLVHFGRSPSSEILVAWLEDSTLSVGIPTTDATPSEVEGVDGSTCDCCNPAPTFVGEMLVVPYRDYAILEGEVVRDTAGARSTDGGATWEIGLPIADDNWFIDACPFSGPSAVVVDGVLVVAFMDARQSAHPDQASSTIWVDVSTDGGATYGTDLAVTSKGINRWPVMAADSLGRVHLVWEIQGPDGGLAYAGSVDGGRSFTDPAMLIRSSDGEGSPKSPSIAVMERRLFVTWTDSAGAQLAIFDLD